MSKTIIYYARSTSYQINLNSITIFYIFLVQEKHYNIKYEE